MQRYCDDSKTNESQSQILVFFFFLLIAAIFPFGVSLVNVVQLMFHFYTSAFLLLVD